MELIIENRVLERFYSDDTELIIPDGVTKIGYNACFLNTQIKKLVIPEGVTAIDENAFRNCSELSDVVLPESITEIGKCAFYGCTKLKKINFPKNLKKIYSMAFAFTGINNMIIPETVEYFASDAFHMHCHPLYTNEKIEDFLAKTDAGFSKNKCVCLKKNVLEKYTPQSFFDEEEEIYIPFGVKGIGNTAFDGAILKPNFRRWAAKKIYIPTTVTQIGKLTFSKCKDIIICACSGSYAEKYARERGLAFEAADYL
jgi:hypothetical protein